MKKVFGLLFFLFLLNGCSDGDVSVNTVDFTGIDPQLCSPSSNVMYMINNNKTETFVLIIPSDLEPYANIIDTTKIDINGDVEVIYRRYNGIITSENICSTIQPGNPSLADEWYATSGTIEIETTPVYSTADPISGATTILKYRHHIVFSNIVFAKPNDTNQVYETMDYGNFFTPAANLPFNFDPEKANICENNNRIYNVALPGRVESLVINNVSSSLINNTVGSISEPIGEETNLLVYQYYQTAIPLPVVNYFCNGSIPPTVPEIAQTWTALPGNTNENTGIINVATELDNNLYKHTITLKKVTFYDAVSGSTFYYGDDILYGIIYTPK